MNTWLAVSTELHQPPVRQPVKVRDEAGNEAFAVRFNGGWSFYGLGVMPAEEVHEFRALSMSDLFVFASEYNMVDENDGLREIATQLAAAMVAKGIHPDGIPRDAYMLARAMLEEERRVLTDA